MMIYKYYAMQVAAAYAVNGPYHGAYAMLPLWKTHVEPQEASHTYLLVAGTTDRTYVPFPGEDPPDLNNAVWVGVSVSVSLYINYRFVEYFFPDIIRVVSILHCSNTLQCMAMTTPDFSSITPCVLNFFLHKHQAQIVYAIYMRAS